jgi:hypothetical protein
MWHWLLPTVSGSTFTGLPNNPTGGTINGHSDSSEALTEQKNTGTTAGIIRYTVIPTANPVGTVTVDVQLIQPMQVLATAQTICSGSTTSSVKLNRYWNNIHLDNSSHSNCSNRQLMVLVVAGKIQAKLKQ